MVTTSIHDTPRIAMLPALNVNLGLVLEYPAQSPCEIHHPADFFFATRFLAFTCCQFFSMARNASSGVLRG